MRKLILGAIAFFGVVSVANSQDFDTWVSETGDDKYVEFNNSSTIAYRLSTNNTTLGTPSLDFEYKSGFGEPSANFSSVMSIKGYNVGVGTINPASRLHVNGNSYFQGAVGIGVASPSVQLDVRRDENPAIKISSNNNGRWVDLGIANCTGCWSGLATDGDVVMRAKPGSNDLVIANQGTGNLILGNGDTGSEVRRLVIASDGNIGMGTSNPDATLDVNGDALVNNLGIATSNPLNKLQIGNSFSFHDGGYEVMGFGYAPGSNTDLNTSGHAAGITLRPVDGKMSLGISNSVTSLPVHNMLVLDKTGNIGIGTWNPDEKLTVKGSIHSEEVIVDLSVPADYVFQKYFNGVSELNPNYTMLDLEEVESFIKENHHLPEIPAAQEIQEDGMELSKMTNLLLQKIEELTIYTIEQEKRIKVLETQLSDRKN